MALQKIRVERPLAQGVYIGEAKVAGRKFGQYLGPHFRRDKLSCRVEEFQRVPLSGVVARRDNNPTLGAFPNYGHLYGRSSRKSGIYHINPHSQQGLDSKLLN